MSGPTDVKVGDRVRVVDDRQSYDGYVVGDIGEVTRTAPGEVSVRWETNLGNKESDTRCALLFDEEYEALGPTLLELSSLLPEVAPVVLLDFFLGFDDASAQRNYQRFRVAALAHAGVPS